ncbi:MAG: 2,3-bisphosphoglycerate-independent phosphoglycerate mutase [Saprospiraceae bacterium]|nr:2,3-bisphosphoglycerate-independent phosphoglycerate mutase [Saprospiraceae bacterium]
MAANKVMLLILDGWGHGSNPASSAISKAHTPLMDELYESYPHAELITYGLAVGLPEGQMGNSEVGHLNIGAGRVVYQDLAKINLAVADGSLAKHPSLLRAFEQVKQSGKRLHYIGLLSDGGVHAHIDHLQALCAAADQHGVPTFVHAFMDGRDTDPKSGMGYLDTFLQFTAGTSVQLASVIGRYFAMDRDNRWERVKLAYDLLVHAKGEPSTDILTTIRQRYDSGETDEFLQPIVCTDPQGSPLAQMEAGDVVLCFNFRTDRPREITTVLTQKDFPELDMYKLPLHYLTLTNYDDTFTDVEVLYGKDQLNLTLGEVVAAAGKTQVRIAETEKYPHVTYFFSGGRETPFEGEKRIMIPSPKVPTYDLQPEMSAYELTAAIIAEIRASVPDFICLNFANADMVGHTGVFDAAVAAAEAVDRCLYELIPVARENDYDVLIIADHGNSDYMVNEDGSPNTAHTKNPVPVIFIPAPDRNDTFQLHKGVLADVAPTILQLMEISQPEAMTGKTLLEL